MIIINQFREYDKIAREIDRQMYYVNVSIFKGLPKTSPTNRCGKIYIPCDIKPEEFPGELIHEMAHNVFDPVTLHRYIKALSKVKTLFNLSDNETLLLGNFISDMICDYNISKKPTLREYRRKALLCFAEDVIKNGTVLHKFLMAFYDRIHGLKLAKRFGFDVKPYSTHVKQALKALETNLDPEKRYIALAEILVKYLEQLRREREETEVVEDVEDTEDEEGEDEENEEGEESEDEEETEGEENEENEEDEEDTEDEEGEDEENEEGEESEDEEGNGDGDGEDGDGEESEDEKGEDDGQGEDRQGESGQGENEGNEEDGDGEGMGEGQGEGEDEENEDGDGKGKGQGEGEDEEDAEDGEGEDEGKKRGKDKGEGEDEGGNDGEGKGEETGNGGKHDGGKGKRGKGKTMSRGKSGKAKSGKAKRGKKSKSRAARLSRPPLKPNDDEDVRKTIEKLAKDAKSGNDFKIMIVLLSKLIGKKLMDGDGFKALRYFYEAKASQVRQFIEYPKRITHESARIGTRKWRINEPINKLDFKRTVMKFGYNIPTITSRAPREFRKLKGEEESRKPIDIVISIDASGSTGFPNGDMCDVADYEVIMFYALLDEAKRNNQKVGLTLWHEDIVFTTLPKLYDWRGMDRLKEEILKKYWNGLDTRIIEALKQARDYPSKLFLMFTDGEVWFDELIDVDNVVFFLIRPRDWAYNEFVERYGKHRVVKIDDITNIPRVTLTWFRNMFAR